MMHINDEHAYDIDHAHIERQSKQQIALVKHTYGDKVCLYYGDDKYEYVRKARKVPFIPVPGDYPDKKYKDYCWGLEIVKNGEHFLYSGKQNIFVGKKGIFSIHIPVNVFSFETGNLFVYTCGPKDSSFHYYCVYDEYDRCVGMIERGILGANGSRSRIYFEDEALLLQMLIINMEITLTYIMAGEMRDSSAGNYISIKKAEIARLDRELLARWKEQYD